MNNLPKFIASMSTNAQGQMSLQQRSLFSFFHQGVPFMVQLSRAYHKGMDVGTSRGYHVRLTCFLGFLPISLYAGVGHRNKVLSLIYRSNYHDHMKFYVNHRQMIIGSCNKVIATDDALNVNKLMSTTALAYEDMYPFINLFKNYVKTPSKVSKHYENVAS